MSESPLLDVHMSADVPVFTAIYDPGPDPDVDDGGMTAVHLDDFGVRIPQSFRQRFDEWYRQLPLWQESEPDMQAVNRSGQQLADELAAIIGQPIAYELPYDRPEHVGRCSCPVHAG